MATLYEIPLSGTPQRFSIQLGDTVYQMVFTYREAASYVAGGGGWIVDIFDTQGFAIACGLPLVTGANLLAQFDYLNFNASMFVISDGDPNVVPTFSNLGTDSHVYWMTLP